MDINFFGVDTDTHTQTDRQTEEENLRESGDSLARSPNTKRNSERERGGGGGNELSFCIFLKRSTKSFILGGGLLGTGMGFVGVGLWCAM